MANSIATIRDEFWSNYDADPQQLRHHIEIAFDKAKTYDKIYGINNFFTDILGGGSPHRKYHWTVDQIQIMIDLGADPRCKGDLPFRMACLYDTSNLARFLMERYGVTADQANMLDLVDYGNINMLRFLLDNGLQPSAIQFRQLARRADFSNLLIELGCDRKVLLESMANWLYPAENYKYVLDIIGGPDCALEEIALIKLFLNALRARTNLTPDNLDAFVNAGLNPFHGKIIVKSCRYGDVGLVQHLINRYGVNVNKKNGKALHYAIIRNNIEMVTLLLDAGCIALDYHIDEALNINKKIVEVLIRRSNINPEEVANRYFQIRMKDGDLGILKMLVDQGVDMNQVIVGIKK